MTKILNEQEDILNNIESDAIKIIEDKLNAFFNSCKKASLAYSFMLADHAEYYSRDTFEMMVLSSKEIEALIQSIIFEINKNNSFYNQDFNLLIMSNSISDMELSTVLKDSIKEYSLSLKITDHCENIINKTVLKAFKSSPLNKVILNILKDKNIGSFVLGKNNCKNIQLKYRKEIHNQIEGILLNTKCLIKNQLTNYILKALSCNELNLKSDDAFVITA